MKKFALKVTLQAGEHAFNMTKLFSSDSLDAVEISREFLSTYYGEPEFENDYCAFYDCDEYAVTVNSVLVLSDEQYEVIKEII